MARESAGSEKKGSEDKTPAMNCPRQRVSFMPCWVRPKKSYSSIFLLSLAMVLAGCAPNRSGVAKEEDPLIPHQIDEAKDARGQLEAASEVLPLVDTEIDLSATYLQPNVKDVDGTPAYVHVTLADMPLRVAIGRPRTPALDGTTRQTRAAAIEAIQLWESAIQHSLPWFRIEFVEKDRTAAVQIEWKRRLAGPYGGFGGLRYWATEKGLRVGGMMKITMQPGLPASAEPLKLDEVRLLVAHEFGHVLGLPHCLDCDSAMNYAWHTRDRVFVTEIDVLTFRALVQQPNGVRVDGSPLKALIRVSDPR